MQAVVHCSIILAVLAARAKGQALDKKGCTGFFCMDATFFNHFGPYFDTTPKMLLGDYDSEGERITEKNEVLPKAVNNDPLIVQVNESDNAIYGGDYAYYYNQDDDDEFYSDDNNNDWKPYIPEVNDTVDDLDELTAPNPNIGLNVEEKNQLEKVETLPVALPFLQNFFPHDEYEYNNYEDYTEKVTVIEERSPPSTTTTKSCRCICEDDKLV